MGMVTRASRNLARNKVRMLLVVLALGISIASSVSVFNGIDATNKNTQSMIDQTNADTQAMIDDTNANSQALIATAGTNSQALIDNATNNTMAIIESVNASTQQMIDDVMADTNATIEMTLEYIEMTKNETEIQMTRIDITNISGGNPPTNEPMADDIVANISLMENVTDVVPVVQNNSRVGPGSQDPGNTGGGGQNGSQGGGPGGNPGDIPGGGQNGSPGQMFRTPDYVVEGLPLDEELDEKYHLLPLEIVQGETLSANDTGKVLLPEDLLAYFGTEVGGVIELNGTNLTVKGTYFNPYSNNTVIMNISDARAILGLESNESSMLMVYAVNSSTVNNVTEQILTAYNTFSAQAYLDSQSSTGQYTQMMQDRQVQQLYRDQERQITSLESSRGTQIAQLNQSYTTQVEQYEDDLAKQVEDLENDREDQLDDLNDTLQDQVSQRERDRILMDTIGSVIVTISMASACLIIFFMMMYNVKERTREIGLFKALGFSKGSIIGQITVEGIFMGLLGGVLGVAIGLVAGPAISRALFPGAAAYSVTSISPVLCIEILAATIALGAIGSLYPAWRAAKKKPVVAMKND